ncbi:hypothetical protein [Amycolatopsis sp. CA-126428]|uniref:hypothetical protein n=1 Tax=Amycolatopsis sp. CA-126428 TaxID=2073158 RepID=UPI000CD2D9F2|nr:hypothetical protein [Amycolatopsis sp. CA-126428]
MSVAAQLVRLYPPAIRRRWGAEIAREAEQAGPRSWFDTAVGAVRLWLRPSDWPETTTGETGRVVVTALVDITTTAGLLLRATGPTSLETDTSHPTAEVWLALILVGLVLAAPLPPLRRSEFARLAVIAVRVLAAPASAFAAIFLIARSGLADHPAGTTDILLVGCYWSTLGFAGIRLCLLTARVGEVAVMPGARRLHVASLLVGSGLALAAVQAIEELRPESVLLSSGFAFLATAVLVVGSDLRHIPPGRTQDIRSE